MNDAGAYLVYFFINGIRTAVLIDDKIPCYYHKEIETEEKKKKFFKDVQTFDKRDYMMMGSSQGKNEFVAENGIV